MTNPPDGARWMCADPLTGTAMTFESLLGILGRPIGQLVVWSATLLILSVVGVYLLRRYRDSTEQSETASDLLTKFQEMRQQGGLEETEFRTIKTILSEQLRDEILPDRQSD